MSMLVKITAEDGYMTHEGAHFPKGTIVNMPDDWARSLVNQKLAVAATPSKKAKVAPEPEEEA